MKYARKQIDTDRAKEMYAGGKTRRGKGYGVGGSSIESDMQVGRSGEKAKEKKCRTLGPTVILSARFSRNRLSRD